jgi:DNA-directed RNA polymerase specialized sigma subunit
MTQEEKSAIIGYYRNGASFDLIGSIMGISSIYAETIVKEYLNKKK